MAYKKILTVQDISCVGQCSLTVALPIISACGIETCVLPSAVLSTHTAGFKGYTFRDLTEDMPDIAKHWAKEKIVFDCVYTGYLGSKQQIAYVEDIYRTTRKDGSLLIVDPAMADHGRRYSGLSEEYARAMESLCRRADIIMPNMTEAAMFAGREYREAMTEEYVSELLDALDHPCVILTGTGYQPGMTGVTIREKGAQFLYTHAKLGKNYHGTGDMFAACFTGALLCGRSKTEAAQIAADFVCKAIEKTMNNPAHWYGVKFEQALPDLIRKLQ